MDTLAPIHIDNKQPGVWICKAQMMINQMKLVAMQAFAKGKMYIQKLQVALNADTSLEKQDIKVLRFWLRAVCTGGYATDPLNLTKGTVQHSVFSI
jgi:hypothetical protein